MGTEAAGVEGAIATLTDGEALSCSAKAKRAAKAVRLGDAVVQLARAPIAAGGRQVAWHLARCLVGHVLDFDVCVLPLALTGPYGREVEGARPDLGYRGVARSFSVSVFSKPLD